jgi:hypothetical protein
MILAYKLNNYGEWSEINITMFFKHEGKCAKKSTRYLNLMNRLVSVPVHNFNIIDLSKLLKIFIYKVDGSVILLESFITKVSS